MVLIEFSKFSTNPLFYYFDSAGHARNPECISCPLGILSGAHTGAELGLFSLLDDVGISWVMCANCV